MDYKYRDIYQNIPAVVAIHDEVTGEIIDANKMALMVHECISLNELKSKSLFGEPPYSLKEVVEHIHLAAQKGHHEFEWVSYINGEEKHWFVRQTRVRLEGINSIVMVSTDITELKKTQEVIRKQSVELERMANYDYLTNLPSRRMFYDILSNSIKHANHNRITIAVLFVDFDDFKAINDNYGHDKGDLVLTTTARRLLGSVRSCDTVSRMGGDEFVILLENVKSISEIEMICSRIIKSINEGINLDNLDNASTEITITSSIGVAIMPLDGENAKTLITNADKAMYVAKNKGKNRFAFKSRQYDL